MKKRNLELTPRLQQIADWVPQGATLADVGTDHGYLPVWLTIQRRIRSAVATDLRVGPLTRGRENAASFGVSDSIDFRLCGGLSRVGPEETDTVAIAGMGGEKIAVILSDAPWTADGRHRLLLQPMTRTEELRCFLSCNGYMILRERLVYDRGTLYSVLEATGGAQTLSLGELYGGVGTAHDPLGERYLIEQILRFQRTVAGLNRAGSAEKEKADQQRDVIGALLVQWEEWRHANGS